jgi:putative membrane protein
MFEFMNMNMTMFHSFAMILFWGVIIFILVSIVSSRTACKKEESALDILKKRLAKGEISKEEYESLKDTFK